MLAHYAKTNFYGTTEDSKRRNAILPGSVQDVVPHGLVWLQRERERRHMRNQSCKHKNGQKRHLIFQIRSKLLRKRSSKRSYASKVPFIQRHIFGAAVSAQQNFCPAAQEKIAASNRNFFKRPFLSSLYVSR